MYKIKTRTLKGASLLAYMNTLVFVSALVLYPLGDKMGPIGPERRQ
jgi:hypothetical protein